MKTISPKEARAAIASVPAESVAVIDVRSPDEFRHEHVAGSMNLPLETVLEHAETLRAYRHVYVYCRSGNRSGQACARLHDARIEGAVSIEGGIEEMKRAGFAAVRGSRAIPLQRQVLLGAGIIVATGIALSFLVSPWFQLISLGAAVGLVYAGLSGNCMLGMALERMPWNKRS